MRDLNSCQPDDRLHGLRGLLPGVLQALLAQFAFPTGLGHTLVQLFVPELDHGWLLTNVPRPWMVSISLRSRRTAMARRIVPRATS
jgi:hypothetical protein